jgi:ribosome maturation factor RimP
MNHFDTIKQYIQDILQGTDSFVVSEHNLPGNGFKFLIDADTSFDIKKCVSTARQLRKKIEDAALFPEGDFTMEISSPGVDEPLVLPRQFVKNIGRLVEISFLDKETKTVIGRLKTVTEEALEIEITDKKKKTVTQQVIDIIKIKQTIVQIEF